MSADKQLPTIQGVTFAPFQLTQTAPLTPLEQKLYSALTTQADFIEEIVNRNRELFKKLEMLKREMTQLQEQTQEGEKEDERSEQPGKDTVVGLIGNETGRYEWALEVDGRLPEPLCKGKYFQFKVKLVPLHETPFPLEERVQLTVAIYSAEKNSETHPKHYDWPSSPEGVPRKHAQLQPCRQVSRGLLQNPDLRGVFSLPERVGISCGAAQVHGRQFLRVNDHND